MMKMTCNTPYKNYYHKTLLCIFISRMYVSTVKNFPYPGSIFLHISPVLMKLHNVQVLQLNQVVENGFDLLLKVLNRRINYVFEDRYYFIDQEVVPYPCNWDHCDPCDPREFRFRDASLISDLVRTLIVNASVHQYFSQ